MAENDGFAMGYALGQDSGGGSNSGGGWGNFSEGIWAVIILAILFGRGGFGGGFGGFGGGGGDGVSAGFAWQGIDNGIRGIQQGLCDGFYAVNTGMLNGFHGVDNAVCSLGYNVQNGFNSLSHQLSDCCCATQRAIDNVRYDMATQACDTRQAINNSTREILDFLTQDKIASLTAENQSLKFAASQASQNAFITANQEAQTAELIRRLGRDCPVPAYVVPNPNCCYGNPLGVGYNGGNSCGCGC